MRKLPLICTLALLACQTTAQTLPDYSDNRSTAADVVASLYNAINRHEYLRVWSYYRPDSAPAYPGFAAGYGKTARVDLRIGPVASDRAAGSIHSLVPVALRAVAMDGTISVFEGCYQVTQVQPALQETPPFRPIMIDEGHLKQTAKTFAAAMGTCP